MEQVSEQQRAARIWALADDEHLKDLLAWRIVRKRAEAGGFNGLLITDLTRAGQTLDAMLLESRS